MGSQADKELNRRNEDLVAQILDQYNVPYKRGVLFAKNHGPYEGRKWESDFIIEKYMIAIEYEGGVVSGKGHASRKRFLEDVEKYNAYSIYGYSLLRFTYDDLKAPTILAKTVLQLIDFKKYGHFKTDGLFANSTCDRCGKEIESITEE